MEKITWVNPTREKTQCILGLAMPMKQLLHNLKPVLKQELVEFYNEKYENGFENAADLFDAYEAGRVDFWAVYNWLYLRSRQESLLLEMEVFDERKEIIVLGTDEKHLGSSKDFPLSVICQVAVSYVQKIADIDFQPGLVVFDRIE